MYLHKNVPVHLGFKKNYLRCSKNIPNSACQASTARLEWRAGTCQSMRNKSPVHQRTAGCSHRVIDR